MNKAKSYESKPERKNGAKIVALILCLFVLLALGLSIAGNVIMFNKLKATAPTELESDNTPSVIVTPQEPGEAPAPLSLSAGVATVAADDVTAVPVTVTSSNPNEQITWSIAFNNPDSTWATGKTVTDYVTVVPTSDGALTATVAVSQAFQEQIIVTATSRIDTTASVSCTVDYGVRRKLNGLTFEIKQTAYNYCGANIIPDVTTSAGTLYSTNSTSLTIGFTSAYQVIIDTLLKPMYSLAYDPLSSFNAYFVDRQFDYSTEGCRIFGFSNVSGNPMTFMDIRSSAENYNFQLGKLLGLYSLNGNIKSTIVSTRNVLIAREQSTEALRSALMKKFNEKFIEGYEFLNLQLGAQKVQVSESLIYYIIPDIVEIQYTYMSNNQQVTKVFKYDFIIAPFVLT